MQLDGAVIDLDGTVYRGEELLPGADRSIETLRAAGVDVAFVSNNATRTPAEYVARLESMGIDVELDRIVTAGTVTRSYLEANHADDKIHLVGEDGLRKQFSAFDLTTDPMAADVVVASIDRSFSYDRLAEVVRAFLANDPVFVGTNPDLLTPIGGGEFAPGSGAIIGAIAVTVEREPDPMLGKPSPEAAEAVLAQLACPPERCLVVGDRLDTDIALGEQIGATTVLVRTGMHDEADLGPDTPQPDFVLDSLAEIERVLEAEDG